MSTPILVILNPASCSGRARRMARGVERILRDRGREFRLQLTEAPAHAVELARGAVEEGVETVVAVGGDGTVHEVANGLLAASGSSPGPEPGALPALAIV
ncbi:MAG: diacylglycerol kinase family lipid kinase, partial [Gemmatimonadetes bacterium]|nr:acylglycerol kinase family protein [Gemmatimonadota bacterium]NIT89296.1 acylglycerol kinase family protein [Gemmatimonadota bacterium]NIU33902.1 acylglycerol kinase family protein [Gemmatimonadota bacterium]NIU38088.1 diacylglycerol kinase family lipid kinase [Gemmatimonadota bacterium]NIV64236.1 diacylglycerol kinase family lipid kinase [Gemmatimonadota bacterium]